MKLLGKLGQFITATAPDAGVGMELHFALDQQ